MQNQLGYVFANETDTFMPNAHSFNDGWRNVKIISSGECRRVRDCCIFRVNDCEVFL